MMTSGFQKKRLSMPLSDLRPGLVASLLLALFTLSCGETFRPIAQPVLGPQPNPSAFHFVISISTSGAADPGSASRIDVSGDTTVGVLQTGVAPTHATLIPNGTKLYVTNAGEDTVSANNTSTPTVATTISLPSGSQPVFVTTAENANVYVANYAANTVSVINATSNVVTANVLVGTHPVAMAEMPNPQGSLQKLYVANQGSGDVTVINALDATVGTTIPIGNPASSGECGSLSPVWVSARSDSARIYVLDSSGTICDIGTLSDSVIGVSASVGAGANFMDYDPVAQRLYVTNPTNSQVAILDATSDPPSLLSTIDLSSGASAPCPGGCSPVAVTGLGDGSRAYVASYQIAPCANSSGNCVNSQVEVIDARSNLISKVIPISSSPIDVTNPTDCGPAAGPPLAVWTPGTARFRLFAASSGGGTNSSFKVYVSQCDAGNVAVIDTFPANSNPADFYNNISLAAPLSSFPPSGQPAIPPSQNPVFVVAGP